MRIESVGALRPVVVLLTGAALLASAPVRADDDPPVIEHVPVTRAERDATVEIVATITDESDVFAPTLYYRHPGVADATHVPLQRRRSDGAYVAQLTASATLLYWLEAYDEHGNGPARFGSPDQPFRIVVAGSAAVADSESGSSGAIAPVSAVVALAPDSSPSDEVMGEGWEESGPSLDVALVPLDAAGESAPDAAEAIAGVSDPASASTATTASTSGTTPGTTDPALVVADAVASAVSPATTPSADPSAGSAPEAATASQPAAVTEVPAAALAPVDPSVGGTGSERRPFYTQWWFFTGAGAVAAAAVTTVVVLAAQPEPEYRNTFGLSVVR